MNKPVKDMLKKINNWKDRHNNQIIQVWYGEQDQIDILSYAGLEEQASYLIMNDEYIRTIFVAGFPYIASTGWLNMLINMQHTMDISYHIDQVDGQYALPLLQRKITELESTKRSMIKNGRIIGTEVLDPLESAYSLRDKIQRGQEKLFQLSIYIGLTADSLNELNKKTKLIESVLATKLFYTKTAVFQQLEGLQSMLPRGENVLGQKRNVDSSTASTLFPFISSELIHESGIFYGINKGNNSLVILDRFLLQNANSIIFAQSGSGKSYTAKVEIIRQLMQGTTVIVIDPEREYKQLANSMNGTYIKLSTTSEEKINPFNFIGNTTEKKNISEQIQDLTNIISLMVDGLTPEEKAVVDHALLQTYKWSKKRKGREEREPLLKDFYHLLKAMKQEKLCMRLDKFVNGSLAYMFDGQTNINLNNRLVIFDMKDLPESIRQMMMMVVTNYIQHQIKEKPQKRLLVIDEAWILLQHEESARFISGLIRRARKYYLGVSIISQQANDFLKNEYGKTIASQSSLRILMRQDTTTIKSICSEFALSKYEENFLLTCNKGEALMIADQNHCMVKIIASPKEHPLITTDPSEIYKKVSEKDE